MAWPEMLSTASSLTVEFRWRTLRDLLLAPVEHRTTDRS
jgi:hypothetical protein